MSRSELSHSAGDIESFRCRGDERAPLTWYTPAAGGRRKKILFWLRNSDARRHFCLKPMRTAGIFFVHYPDVKVCRGGARETKTIKSRRQRRFLLETLYAAGWVSRLRLIERTLCKWRCRQPRRVTLALCAECIFWFLVSRRLLDIPPWCRREAANFAALAYLPWKES